MPRFLTFMLVLLLGGCASEPVRKADEALIVFIRPGMTREMGSGQRGSGSYEPTYGTAFSVTVHQVTGAETKLVAILSVGKKFGYAVRPGRHQFMLLARNSESYLEANVVAGKTYYVIVEPAVASTRHVLRPMRQRDLEGREFQEMDRSASFVERPAGWATWDEKNAGAINRRLERTPARPHPTLEIDDGR